MRSESLSEIDVRVEIDEEGFPVFGGLRIDDEELLSDIFQNLQRFREDELSSKIVTQMKATANGKWAWIDAFDEPFVVQSVAIADDRDKTAQQELVFCWQCLGGLVFNVAWKDLYVDEHSRFHSYLGDQKIPSVLSRKAQAQLLEIVAQYQGPELSEPRRYRSAQTRNNHKPDEAEFWKESWESGPGWDMGQPHPYLREKLEQMSSSEGPRWFYDSIAKNSQALLLVPGAGAGHDADFIANHLSGLDDKTWKVKALDFADNAVDAFQSTYSASLVKYLKVNVFEFLRGLPSNSVDAVFEHTFLCAIAPEDRQGYLEQVHRVLKPGASYFGIYFLLEHHGGPPFAITQWELRETLQPNFLIKEWERIVGLGSDKVGGRVNKELWARFTKK